MQLRNLQQANYKIYITDSVVACCTGAETRPILCSVFQNLRLGTHTMTAVLRKNHSPGSVLNVSTRFVGRVACGRKCGRWRRRTSPSCTKNRERLAEIDLHDTDEAFFHSGAPPRVLRPPPTRLIGICHIKSTHRIMIRISQFHHHVSVIDVPKRGFLKGLFVESSTYCECATFVSLQWHGLGNLWDSIFDTYKTHYLHCTRLWLQGRPNERIASCR